MLGGNSATSSLVIDQAAGCAELDDTRREVLADARNLAQ